eukprot:CAMPEP_0196655880 /NCGR_PEP_ID=MMETSP1086-20130531/10005_1 /TAXON_ID=77921 /ORGANISM="Cyanoptyche  gloeocystis , Strain SAG4.97" /LENGTH=191 /DNA_ID=CAMNT_0041988405 /DNA_START=34 /DNA_END=609 /DNA_ORIENTATION=-
MGDVAVLPIIKCVLILDSEGKRIACKYYTEDYPTVASQLAFEKSLFNKTHRINARAEAEILMFEGVIFVYRFSSDVHFYVGGSQNENELILVSVLTALYDSISTLLRSSLLLPTDSAQVERRNMLENMETVFLALDELIDGGIVLETDASVVASRVCMKTAGEDVPLSEQTLSQVLASAKEHMARNLLSSK